jgi:hypothetical protein
MMDVKPCRKCGSTKTGSVPRGLLFKLARIFGYRLRLCGGCRRLRLIPLEPEGGPETIRQPESKPPTPAPAPAPVKNIIGCPYCRSTEWRRSRRRWYDRLMKRPKMARCRTCRRRFPQPFIPLAPEGSVTQKSA